MNANESDVMMPGLGLLLFRSGCRLFCLPDGVVQEILPAGLTTPLPFTPPWVDGLANISGRVIPQASLGALLGENSTSAAQELLVLRTPRADCVLRVDEVLQRVEVAAGDVQAFLPADAGAAGAYVCGEVHIGDEIVLLLDPERLGELFSAREPARGEAGLLGSLEEKAGAVVEDRLGCLAFMAGGERYAMDLRDIGEIIEAGAVTAIPGAPAAVTGLSTLRDEPLLMVSLAGLLGLPPGPQTKALVVKHGELRVGLLLDDIDGIVQFPLSALRALGEAAGDIAGVLHDAAGTVLGLLSVERLLRPERERLLAGWVPTQRREHLRQVRKLSAHLEVSLGGERFGIPLNAVQRILPWSAPEALDDARGRVRGVVNIEGAVVPVLAGDGLYRGRAESVQGAWVIVGDESRPWALAVDEACAIVQVPLDGLERIGNGDGLLEAVANVDGRLLSILAESALFQTAAA